jgi:hypothetical protein
MLDSARLGSACSRGKKKLSVQSLRPSFDKNTAVLFNVPWYFRISELSRCIVASHDLVCSHGEVNENGIVDVVFFPRKRFFILLR